MACQSIKSQIPAKALWETAVAFSSDAQHKALTDAADGLHRSKILGVAGDFIGVVKFFEVRGVL